MAFLVLLIAILSRLVPHMLHMTGANVTLVGAGVLFFGASLRRGNRAWALLPVALLAATDYWLTVYAYGYPFHLASYLPTLLWYGAVCLGASFFLHRRYSLLHACMGAVASSTGFFLLSNGMVWLRGNMYAHTTAGLGQCYLAGLPFYRNDLASTVVFAAVFFALPLAATILRQSAHQLQDPRSGLL